MANTILAKMAVQIAANTAEFNKALDKTSKDISSFSKNVSGIAVGLAAAFSVKQVVAFGIEISKLAAEAEGVSSAFQKIQGSTVLLNQMRQATEGTVDDLKLMKLAVSAVNNGAPLNDLAEILNFIDRSADATGKNFEELADTIIKNIGKESTKGLNELGLNIDKIKTSSDKIGFLPSLMEEVRRKSQELGEISSKTADSYDRQTAAIDNLKASWGALINSTGVSAFLDKVSSVFDLLSGRQLTGTKEQVDKALVAYKQLMDDAKIKGNREEYMKWAKEIANLSSQYGLLKDKAIDPVSQSITHNTVKVKELVKEISKARREFLAMMGFTTAAEKVRARKDDPERGETEPLQSFKFDAEFTGAMASQDLLLSSFIVSKNKQLESLSDEFKKLGDSAMIAGDIIASSLEGAFSGAFSGVQLLARATSQIVDLFAKQAIAAAIANAAKAGGPFPFAAVILATSAAAAMKGLLSRVGVKGGGGGGGISRPSAGGGGGFNNQSFAMAQNAQQTLSLDSVIRGQDLYIVLSNYDKNNKSTRSSR